VLTIILSVIHLFSVPFGTVLGIYGLWMLLQRETEPLFQAGVELPWEVGMFEGLFQPMHLLVILVIAQLVFGPKRLGEIGKGLGEGIRAFRQGARDDKPAPESKPPDEGNKQAK
jgi:sec-independent protein translocase protein TatA